MIAAFTETATTISDASKTHVREVFDKAVACGAIGIDRFRSKVFMMPSTCRYQLVCCWCEDRDPGIGIREGKKLIVISAA